ncbi:MAG: hypothetical protein ACREUQ_05595 [Burkholderiales bacterium]
MPRPLSKEHLAVLRTIARGQPMDNLPDETIMATLQKSGLIANRRGRWTATDAGKAELERRKAAAEGAAAPAPDAGTSEAS